MTLNGRGLKADSTLRIVSMVAVMEACLLQLAEEELGAEVSRWLAGSPPLGNALSRTSSRANRIAGGYPRE